jgi:SAM-dependent methyltransferase
MILGWRTEHKRLRDLATPRRGGRTAVVGWFGGAKARYCSVAIAGRGVDISPEMISQATAAAGDDPRFTFAQHDVAQMPMLGTFDLAVAIYLLRYAKTVEELTMMYRNIAANLRPGGHLVALTVDSDFHHGQKNTEQYSFSVRPEADPHDEDPLSFTMFSASVEYYIELNAARDRKSRSRCSSLWKPQHTSERPLPAGPSRTARSFGRTLGNCRQRVHDGRLVHSLANWTRTVRALKRHWRHITHAVG